MSELPSVVQSPSNVPYVVAVLVMSVIGALFVLGIYAIRPTADNTQLIATVLGFLAPTTFALLAFMKSQETHLSVNSRLDAFMKASEENARATGFAEGHTKGLGQAVIIAANLKEAAGSGPKP